MAPASNWLRRMFSSSEGLPNHLVARWLFLRTLGLIYFSAFFSLIFQIKGLIGPRGILPAGEFLTRVAVALGPLRFWYASLGTWTDYPIVPRTEERLLTNDPDVLGLFAGNPFPSAPPKYVRAVLWQYWFSTPVEKRRQGVWWRRQLLGTYAPTLTFAPGGKVVAIEMPSLSDRLPPGLTP